MMSSKTVVRVVLVFYVVLYIASTCADVSAPANNLPINRIYNPDDKQLLGDGIRGRYMKEIRGTVHVSFNSTFVFTPASLIKALIHAHALRQVQKGRDRLKAKVKIYTNLSGSCPLDSGGPLILTLKETLRGMMVPSDNRHTEALVKRYKQRNINLTGKSLGLQNTKLRERLGCFPAASIKPSRMTLVDTGKLFEEVATRFLKGKTRRTFFRLMVDFNSPLEEIVDTVSSVNPARRNRFKKKLFSRYKDGFYYYSTGIFYRTVGAYVRLPFRLCNGTIESKEYTLAAFVYKSSTPIDYTVFLDWAADTMRREIKRAVNSFRRC